MQHEERITDQIFRSRFIRPIWSKTVTNWIDESILYGKYVFNDKRQFLLCHSGRKNSGFFQTELLSLKIFDY